MNFKDISKKLLQGDLSVLLNIFRSDRNTVHPAEIAKMLGGLPLETSFRAFQSLPPANQVRIFPYLDLRLQRTIARQLSREQITYILNALSSDDRMAFYSSMKGAEAEQFLSYLNQKNKDSTNDLLGYPDDSVARLVNTDFASIH